MNITGAAHGRYGQASRAVAHRPSLVQGIQPRLRLSVI